LSERVLGSSGSGDGLLLSWLLCRELVGRHELPEALLLGSRLLRLVELLLLRLVVLFLLRLIVLLLLRLIVLLLLRLVGLLRLLVKLLSLDGAGCVGECSDNIALKACACVSLEELPALRSSLRLRHCRHRHQREDSQHLGVCAAPVLSALLCVRLLMSKRSGAYTNVCPVWRIIS